MLGVKATRKPTTNDCAMRVNLNRDPILHKPIDDQPKQLRKMVYFQENPEMIEINSRAPKFNKLILQNFIMY